MVFFIFAQIQSLRSCQALLTYIVTSNQGLSRQSFFFQPKSELFVSIKTAIVNPFCFFAMHRHGFVRNWDNDCRGHLLFYPSVWWVCNEKTRLKFHFCNFMLLFLLWELHTNENSEKTKEACHLFPAHSNRRMYWQHWIGVGSLTGYIAGGAMDCHGVLWFLPVFHLESATNRTGG